MFYKCITKEHCLYWRDRIIVKQDTPYLKKHCVGTFERWTMILISFLVGREVEKKMASDRGGRARKQMAHWILHTCRVFSHPNHNICFKSRILPIYGNFHLSNMILVTIGIHGKRKVKKYLLTEGTDIITEGTVIVTEGTLSQGTVIGNRGENCNKKDSNRGGSKYIASATTHRVFFPLTLNFKYWNFCNAYFIFMCCSVANISNISSIYNRADTISYSFCIQQHIGLLCYAVFKADNNTASFWNSVSF